MFKKLRIQFVAIVMTSVAVVLALVFAGICIAEYQRARTDVDEALSSSIDRANEHMGGSLFGLGAFSGQGSVGPGGSGHDSGFNGRSSATGNGESGEGASYVDDLHDGALDSMAETTGFDGFEDMTNGPRIGGPRGDDRSALVFVAVYMQSSDGQLQIVSGYATASIDSSVLDDAYARLADSEDGAGTLGDLGLHYKKSTTSNGTYYAFADMSNTDSWKTLAIMLAIAGAGVLIVFFFIALALSNWTLKPVREAWDAQRQFVADASHDLKTPLTVILANASILLKHPDHTIASESQWIESTQIEAQQMQGLVNEMLELAQVEAGQQVATAPFEPVDFSDLVDGETLLFDSVALERNCAFSCEIAEGVTVNGNSQQLHKMVSTLVENAFKYVDDRGSISVGLVASGKNAQLTVTNTGSLIAPDDLPHIFDRFYRTDKARTSGAGGFGLGLAIAREVARSHGGDITCSSSADAGTTFSVTLPAR